MVRESQEITKRSAVTKGPWHGPGGPASAGERSYRDQERADCQGP